MSNKALLKQQMKEHLPQIQAWYEGELYPFFAGASLKELIAMRNQKLNSDTFCFYNKDARAVYFEHLSAIEQCIRILLAEPLPHRALEYLEINDAQCQKRQRSHLHDLLMGLYEITRK